MSPAYQRVAVINGGCWKGSRHRRQGRLDCFLSRDGAQVAAKRDGIAAVVHLQTAAGGREDLEWAWLAFVLHVCCCCVPRRLIVGQAFHRPSGVCTKPVLDAPAWGECVGEIGRRRVEGEVRRVLRIGVHVCAGTSRALCEIVYGMHRVPIARYAWIHTPRWSMERAAGEVD